MALFCPQLAEEQQSSAERRSRRCSELIKHHEENLQKLREELDSLIVQQKQLKEEVEKKHTFGELMDKAVKAGRRVSESAQVLMKRVKGVTAKSVDRIVDILESS